MRRRGEVWRSGAMPARNNRFHQSPESRQIAPRAGDNRGGRGMRGSGVEGVEREEEKERRRSEKL